MTYDALDATAMIEALFARGRRFACKIGRHNIGTQVGAPAHLWAIATTVRAIILPHLWACP